MSERAAKFLVDWLETNISDISSILPLNEPALAGKCAADACALGIALEEIEAVAGSIEEAILDQVEYLIALESMAPPY